MSDAPAGSADTGAEVAPRPNAVVAVLAFALGAFLFDRLRDTLAEEV